MSAVNVAFETRLQEAARDESRAGFLSLSSLLMTLCAMALAPLIGAAGDSGGLVRIGAVSGGDHPAGTASGSGGGGRRYLQDARRAAYQSLTGTPRSMRRSTSWPIW
ncbi:MAG: hypothetical protein MZV70_67925 [Desulfobacterales bacterium]|nr:hypothetical protein [Desulfobacterales bacterium]